MSLYPVVVAIVSPVFGSDIFSSLPPPPRRGRDDERAWERGCNHPDIWVPQNLFVKGVTPLTRKAVQKNA